MLNKFNFFLHRLLQLANQDNTSFMGEDIDLISQQNEDKIILYRTINAAFLIVLCGNYHRQSNQAGEFLERMAQSDCWEEIANFYLTVLLAIEGELNMVSQQEPEVVERLESVVQQLDELEGRAPDQQIVELFWSFTHPEATGIWSHESQRIADLRIPLAARYVQSPISR